MTRILTANFIQAAYSFVIIVLLSFVLDLEKFGSFGSIVGLATICFTSLNAGISVKYIYKVASNQSIDYDIRNTIINNKTLLHLPIVLIICTLYSFLLDLNLSEIEVFLLVVYVFSLNIQQVIIGEITSLRKYSEVVSLELFFKFTIVVCTSLSIFVEQEITITTLSVSALFATVTIIARKNFFRLSRINLTQYMSLMKSSKNYFLNSIFENLFWRLGIIVSPLLISLEDAGKLQVNITVLMAMNLIPIGLVRFLYPFFGVSNRKDRAIFTRGVVYITGYALIAYFSMVFVASEAFWVGLGKFVYAVENRNILILAATLIAISRVCKNLLIMNDAISLYNAYYARAFLLVIPILFLITGKIYYIDIIFCMAIFEFIVIGLCSRAILERFRAAD